MNDCNTDPNEAFCVKRLSVNQGIAGAPVLVLIFCSTLAVQWLLIPAFAAAAERESALGRVAWNDSTVIGFPDPPPPYEVTPFHSSLSLQNPMGVTRLPGTQQLLVHVHQGGYGGPGRLLQFNPTDSIPQLKEFLVLDEIIYGVAFHPQFEENGFMYVGCNGRSEELEKTCTKVLRFRVKREGAYECDLSTEVTVIEWASNGHNGGDLAFGNDGLLYVSAGDGTSDSDAKLAGQDLTTLPGSLLRIDVNTISAGQTYSIPPDNPFLNLDGARGEIWAYGLRNPWRISVDSKTGDLWAGINGQDLWETAQVVRRGENYGWSITEGSQPFQPQRQRGPTPIITPTIEHAHSEARSLTGGHVYYGKQNPLLYEHYIYGDYSTGMIWAAKYRDNEVVSHFTVARTNLQIVGFGIGHDGELIIVDHGGGLYTLSPTRQTHSTDFPRRLSETGIYTSVANHQVHPGLIPYQVNSPLWSDGATKERFIGLPDNATIDFREAKSWDFPDGTVLVKTFSLPIHDAASRSSNQDSHTRIETRLMTRQSGQWYGYSYEWNSDQTDATLVSADGLDKDFQVASDRNDGGSTTKQTWHYPSRSECMVCHSRASNFVLGLSVPQTNLELDQGPKPMSQLEHFKQLGLFHPTIGAQEKADPADSAFDFPEPVPSLPRLVNPADVNETLEKRVRSYLHANCANCHVKEGGGNSKIVLSYNRAIDKTGLLNQTPLHGAFGLLDAKLIKPGFPLQSVLVERLRRRGPGQMPPLASSSVDTGSLELIMRWISEMPQVSEQ